VKGRSFGKLWIVRRRLFASAALASLGALCTSFAPNEAIADPILDVGRGDVSVQADQLDLDVAAGTAVLTGQVVLSKGDLAVHCPKFELKFDSSPHLTWAKGSGGVVADVRGVHGEAPEVELDLRKQILELRGGVKLSRGQGWIQAEKASIELTTARVTATQVKGSIPVPK
jgi:lipopolysaccharide transport protein LptA